jgi:hypothetical protein
VGAQEVRKCHHQGTKGTKLFKRVFFAVLAFFVAENSVTLWQKEGQSLRKNLRLL